jgi:uncharacterized protein
MKENIKLDLDGIIAFCKRNHISKFSIFGSVLGKDFGPDSDLDILVEFKPGHTPGFSFFGMEAELAAIFGRKVDLNTPKFLSRYFRSQVMQEAETLYEEAA